MNKFFRILGGLVLAAILLLSGLLTWFLTSRASRAHSLASEVLSPALASARSVTISERIPYENMGGPKMEDMRMELKELAPKTVTLSPIQIAELSRAVAGHFDYGRAKVPGCYRPPYHRIEIVCGDGAVLIFDVSFYCGLFEFEGHRHPLPTLLFNHLRDCFARFGLPPRSEKAYGALVSEVQKR